MTMTTRMTNVNDDNDYYLCCCCCCYDCWPVVRQAACRFVGHWLKRHADHLHHALDFDDDFDDDDYDDGCDDGDGRDD